MHVPPSASVRIAPVSRSSDTSFNSHPFAPARTASKRFASSSNVVRMRVGGRPCNRLSTPTPSSFGMRRSSSTTSGFVSSMTPMASSPSAASPAISMSPERPRSERRPWRTIVWSSVRRREACRKRFFHDTALHRVRARLQHGEDARLPYPLAQALERGLDRGRVMGEIVVHRNPAGAAPHLHAPAHA